MNRAETAGVRSLAKVIDEDIERPRGGCSTLASAADLGASECELRITLAPLSSPHRSRAIAALCRELDAARATFPGTRLRLRFAVASYT